MSDPAAARERTIALVEHHADRLALLRRGLQQAGFAVLAHADATSLAAADLAPPPGLFLLDLSNSGEPGLALIGELRRRAAAPIIVITGKVSAATRASGLELGADDHVAWPCDMRRIDRHSHVGRLPPQHRRLWQAITGRNQVGKEIRPQSGEMVERVGRPVVAHRHQRTPLGTGDLDRYGFLEAAGHDPVLL